MGVRKIICSPALVRNWLAFGTPAAKLNGPPPEDLQILKARMDFTQDTRDPEGVLELLVSSPSWSGGSSDATFENADVWTPTFTRIESGR